MLSRLPVYREGIAVCLRQDPRFVLAGISIRPDVVAGAGKTTQAGIIGNAGNIDVLLTDLSSPIAEEIALIKAIKKQKRNIVVILVAPEQAEDVCLAMSAGADAYLSKSLAMTQIANGLVAIHGGEPPPTDPLLDARLRARKKRDKNAANPSLANLNDEERQIILMLSRGLTNREVAASLGDSARTIRRRLVAINGKLGVRNRLQAIAKFLG